MKKIEGSCDSYQTANIVVTGNWQVGTSQISEALLTPYALYSLTTDNVAVSNNGLVTASREGTVTISLKGDSSVSLDFKVVGESVAIQTMHAYLVTDAIPSSICFVNSNQFSSRLTFPVLAKFLKVFNTHLFLMMSPFSKFLSHCFEFKTINSS